MRRLAERLSVALRGERSRRYFVLAGLLAIFAAYKLAISAHTFATHVDGGYYTDIATHVRDGHGLVTNVSILHKGYPYFPHPTSVYPLWPLLLGYVSRLSSLEVYRTGIWLSTLFYFVALMLAYGWASTLFPKPLFPKVFPSFDAGHLLVVMLGLNKFFFYYTSYPMTEGIGYAVLFGALWRFHGLWRRPGWAAGAEMGVWCGVVMLVRTQMMLLALATATALAFAVLACGDRRKQFGLTMGCFVAAMAATVLPHLLFIRTFIPDAGLFHLLRFDQVRVSDTLSTIPVIKKVPGVWPYIVDRAQGIPQAFHIDRKHAYVRSFFTYHYALPLSIPFLLAAARNKTRADVARAWDWVRTPHGLSAGLALVLALGGLSSTHIIHRAALNEWIFGMRQALPCIFIFFLALLYLLNVKLFPARMLAVLLIGSSVYAGWSWARKHDAKLVDKGAKPFKAALVKWINDERGQRDSLTIAFKRPQEIARLTPGVGYHWFYKKTTIDDVEAMFQVLGADYLMFPSGNYAFAKTKRFRKHFKLITWKSGYRIYEPRGVFKDELADAKRSADRR